MIQKEKIDAIVTDPAKEAKDAVEEWNRRIDGSGDGGSRG
jgi:hypothetical protein